MSAIAFPWLRLELADPGRWMAGLDDHALELLGAHLAHWDYAARVRLERCLSLDLDTAAQALRLPREDLALDIVVTLGTGGARGERARRVAWRGRALHGDNPILLDCEGHRLSRAMRLTTEIVLASAGNGSRLSPSASMARLWRDTHQVSLEPASDRFPMEVTSFKVMFPNGEVDAPWHLEWSPADLDRDFAACVRLYLNRDLVDFTDRFAAGDATTMRLVSGAVIVQLCRGVLDGEVIELGMAASQPGSLGGVVAGWLSMAFSGQTLATIRSTAQARPALFDSLLASLAVEEDE